MTGGRQGHGAAGSIPAMDTLTHALSGALLARAIAARAPQTAGPVVTPTSGPSFDAPWRPGPASPQPWQCVVVGTVAAAFPDIDVVTRWVSDLAYLRHHRGVTHSLLLAPLWAFGLAWLAAQAFSVTCGARGGWKSWYAVVLASLLVHIAGDWITQFGTLLLAPFSDRRFGLGSTFIIDLVISGLLVAGLVLAAALPRRRWPALAAYVGIGVWIGVSWIGRQEALTAGEAFARERGLGGANVEAMPRPASPWNWTVAVSDGEAWHVAHLNTRRTRPLEVRPDDHFVRRFSAPYQPLASVSWERVPKFGDAPDTQAFAREAWSHPAFGFYRWFAQVPALDRVDIRTAADGHIERCAWFRDLRFGFPGRADPPFRYGLCRGGINGTVVSVYAADGDGGGPERVAKADAEPAVR
jgi:inner membrane protein